jgi:hypothetical protein
MPSNGFRITIEDSYPSPSSTHRSGGTSRFNTLCPNCAGTMLPVFSLATSDPRVRELGLWSGDVIEVLVCPRCPFYFKPYWVHYTENQAVVLGGNCDGEPPFEDFEPYEVRAISLRALEPWEPGGSAYVERPRPRQVCHQLGGRPFSQSPRALHLTCPLCRSRMQFSGVVDYDDHNVPLRSTTGIATALIIGDADCLHWFTCNSCHVVGFDWATG